jgi:hypothetical protein
MKWFARSHARRPHRRPGTFRPRLEGLEDRLTPSGFVGLDATVQPIAVAPQPASQAQLISLVPPPAAQVSGTYVTGAAGRATAEGVAVGADGSVYVTGLLSDSSLSTDPLAYVKKYSPTGSVVYFTAFAAFAGPGSATEGTGIAVDSAGDAYVSGKAHNVADGTDNGIYLKIDPTGVTAVYFFVQGSGPGGGPVSTNGVAIDTAGDAVFTGLFSPSPTVQDLLAARFTSTGTNTYDNAYNFAPPGSSTQGNADAMPGTGASTTIAGWANVPGVTTAQNADEVKLDALGNPIAAAILVDPTTDSANAVALDAAGNSYVAGTVDIGGPTQSAVVAKIDSGITTLIWAVTPATTAFTGNGIALDSAGNVYTTGADSSGQAYLAKLSGVDGSTTDYKVFGGSGGSDVGNAVAVRSSDGHVFDVGTTNSANFPVTDGSTLNGTTDGFLTEWTYP